MVWDSKGRPMDLVRYIHSSRRDALATIGILKSPGTARLTAICNKLILALIGLQISSLPSVAQSCPVNTPHIQGTWKTLPYLMPINPISATLLRTGKVLIVAGSENDASNNSPGAESYRNAVWDPTGTTGSSIAVQN